MIDLSAYAQAVPRGNGFIDNQADLVVNGSGYRKCLTKDFASSPAGGRLDYQLVYLAEGKGLFRLNGRFEEVRKGSLLVYRPGDEVRYELKAADAPELFWLGFTGKRVRPVLETYRLHRDLLHSVGYSAEAVRLFRQVLAELQFKRPFFRECSEALLGELLALFGRRLAEGRTAGRAGGAILKTAEHMLQNYGRPLTVEDLAAIAGLSRHRYLHAFKEALGSSPIDYLIRLRIDKAKELLLGSDLRVAEIAELVGYDNPLYLSRLFRKRTGFSPLAWRRDNRFGD